MAITGLIFIGFVIVHLLGNLQIFKGPEAVNSYAEMLHHLAGPLWIARAVMLLAFVLHIYTAAILSIENKAARPVPYFQPDTMKATLTSRTMLLSGLVLLAYIVFHILHFTLNKVDPSFTHLVDDQGRHDVYRMLIIGFSNSYISASYIIAMICLGAHLHHGASSVFQSLGLNNSKYRKFTRLVGPAIGLIVTLGYGSIPVAVLMGWVR